MPVIAVKTTEDVKRVHTLIVERDNLQNWLDRVSSAKDIHVELDHKANDGRGGWSRTLPESIDTKAAIKAWLEKRLAEMDKKIGQYVSSEPAPKQPKLKARA